jgi:uncharacterized protein (DUF1919 family)
MKTENLGFVYHLTKEDMIKAIEMLLKAMDQDVQITEVQPTFEREYYPVGMFDQDYREIFDGVKVVCRNESLNRKNQERQD